MVPTFSAHGLSDNSGKGGLFLCWILNLIDKKRDRVWEYSRLSEHGGSESFKKICAIGEIKSLWCCVFVIQTTHNHKFGSHFHVQWVCHLQLHSSCMPCLVTISSLVSSAPLVTDYLIPKVLLKFKLSYVSTNDRPWLGRPEKFRKSRNGLPTSMSSCHLFSATLGPTVRRQRLFVRIMLDF